MSGVNGGKPRDPRPVVETTPRSEVSFKPFWFIGFGLIVGGGLYGAWRDRTEILAGAVEHPVACLMLVGVVLVAVGIVLDVVAEALR